MVGLNDWLSVGRTESLEEIRERILAGYLGGKPFVPYVPTLALPAGLDNVVDVGCGLGRNFPYLTSVSKAIVGFDLPPMIERCKSVGADPAIVLTSDWSDVCASRYALVFSTLVLQHVEPDACRAYIADFARIAPVTYLLTRLQSDFNENVLDLVMRSGAFDAGPCVEVEHDPITNQLRVLRHGTLEDLAGSKEDGHFEVLLRSMVFSRHLPPCP